MVNRRDENRIERLVCSNVRLADAIWWHEVSGVLLRCADGASAWRRRSNHENYMIEEKEISQEMIVA